MTNLTEEQMKQLTMYSVYTEEPAHRLFTLETILQADQMEAILQTIQVISGSPNRTVTASYFTRRFGMFTAMQFTSLVQSNITWKGESNNLVFGVNEEYGRKTVSTYTRAEDWKVISNGRREEEIWHILHNECAAVFHQMRSVTAISPLIMWENIFGFLLWQYHVLLANPSTAQNARKDLELLKADRLWEGIAPKSLFASYLKGCEPSELLNTTVRKTCCLSKDVPGLMQCGFCPLKNAKG
ncbi:hypothetical protein [Sporosarcina sp. HYO08]|uniref:hypothetical protein n=1 Tax=Sporosarcina sp. HYO08 TaxID=1759557 RepID=UPI00079C45FA|nr:hypothetical protein [Sporosarcina sp. HYO08]KXH79297.1 hypothetical protein AU377_12000 [Sporosarcina sp. HYO08]